MEMPKDRSKQLEDKDNGILYPLFLFAFVANVLSRMMMRGSSPWGRGGEEPKDVFFGIQ